MFELSNNQISIKVNSKGAELASLKKNSQEFEYMWTGDAEFWTGQSPVFFPIVGAVENGSTFIMGKEYQLNNHGFARRSEFELVSSTSTELVFALHYNNDTLAMYPFKFELRLIYTLLASSVKITYEIENLDDQTIAFQLGTHPGFNIPKPESFTNYFLEFAENENLKRYFLNKDNLIIPNKEDELLSDSKTLALTHEMFDEGALIFRNVKSQSLSLKSKTDDFFVTVKWENFPYLGIWQPKNAPFVCIEPWHGLSNTAGNNVNYEAKEQIVQLPVSEVFKASISIEI